MYTRMGEAVLKSCERMEIGVVLGPDPEWLPRVAPFLGHKNADDRAHIERSLEGPLDRLETRFYLGIVDGEIACNVMVVGERGAGILGHVFTLPDHRRKGACRAVMERQMEDCRRAGFQVLCLGTRFEGPAYWIYHGFGFRSIAPGSGCMVWRSDPHAERRLFAPGPTSVRDLQWGDWAWFDLIGFQVVGPDEELPRSTLLGRKAQGGLEGPFPVFQWRREREPQIQARALIGPTGATVGWALLAPDPRWYGDAWILDFHALPAFSDGLPELLSTLELPEAPVAAYLTEPEGPKAAALKGTGFRPAAWLCGWLEQEGERRDLAVWTNHGMLEPG